MCLTVSLVQPSSGSQPLLMGDATADDDADADDDLESGHQVKSFSSHLSHLTHLLFVFVFVLCLCCMHSVGGGRKTALDVLGGNFGVWLAFAGV